MPGNNVFLGLFVEMWGNPPSSRVSVALKVDCAHMLDVACQLDRLGGTWHASAARQVRS